MYNIGNCSVIYVSPSLGDDREYNGLSPQPDKFGNGQLSKLRTARLKR